MLENHETQSTYVRLYDKFDSINEHGFASHSSYSPAHRYSTLTFLCQIITENNQRSIIRAVLDNCSNLSILKCSVADKLSMKGEKCDLQLSVTGANKVIFKKQKKVRFRLASLDNKYITDFICEASTAPNPISNSFERIAINPKDYDYLSEIKFTEPLPMSEPYFEAN